MQSGGKKKNKSSDRFIFPSAFSSSHLITLVKHVRFQLPSLQHAFAADADTVAVIGALVYRKQD